jgi:hypothetical protein
VDRTIVLILGLTVLVLVGAIGLTAKRAPNEPTVAVDDPTRPVAVVDRTSFDFGIVSLADERTEAVSVRNDGRSALELRHFATSCDCTFAHVALPDGSSSPEFTMHGTNDWIGQVPPGQTATVHVIYRPAVMPIKGAVTRAVSFMTNDPNQSSVELSFTATVE